MNKDNPMIKGKAIIKEINPESGEVVSKEVQENLIVQTGLNEIAKYLEANNSPATFEYMAVGDGATAGTSPSNGDTSLTNELDRSSAITPSRTDNVVTFTYTFIQSSSSPDKSSLTEMGIFDSSTDDSGIMLNRIIFDTAKDNATNDLEITYEITVNVS